MRRTVIIAGLVLLGMTSTASAELGEKAVSVGSGGLLPNFNRSAAKWRMGAWEANGAFEYGVLQDLYLGVRLGYGQYSGVTDEASIVVGKTTYTGRYAFNGQFLYPRATVRLNLFNGYNLVPYLEGGIGMIWTEYHNSEMLDDQNRSLASVPNWDQAYLIVEGGLVADYRILNLALVGLGIYYAKVVDDRVLNSWLAARLTVSVFWF